MPGKVTIGHFPSASVGFRSKSFGVNAIGIGWGSLEVGVD